MAVECPFQYYLWQCAQSPLEKPGAFSPFWGPILKEFSPGGSNGNVEIFVIACVSYLLMVFRNLLLQACNITPSWTGSIVAVDKRSNLKHCHAVVADLQTLHRPCLHHDELLSALRWQQVRSCLEAVFLGLRFAIRVLCPSPDFKSIYIW